MKRNPYSQKTNATAAGLKIMSAQTGAVSFNAVRQGEPLPSRLKILPWGDTRTTDGDLMRVNAQSVALLPQTQREMNWPHAHIDIEHASIPGTQLFKLAAANGSFPAILGWGTPRVVPDEGLFVEDIVWTPESKRAYEFPDLSGVVKHLADGTVVGLHSFAFCCHGKAEGVTAYSALLNPMEETMDKLLMALLGLKAEDDEAKKLERATKFGAALAALAGGGDDGVKAMSALLKLEPAKLAVLSKLDSARLTALCGLDADKLKALSAMDVLHLDEKVKLLSSMDEGAGAAMTALGKRMGTVEESLKTLAQDNVAARRAKLLGDAAAKGKAVPAAWLEKYGDNLAVLSDMIDGLPEDVVPLSQRSVDSSTARAVTPASKEVSEVAKVFGRKPEDLKGY